MAEEETEATASEEETEASASEEGTEAAASEENAESSGEEASSDTEVVEGKFGKAEIVIRKPFKRLLKSLKNIIIPLPTREKR